MHTVETKVPLHLHGKSKFMIWVRAGERMWLKSETGVNFCGYTNG